MWKKWKKKGGHNAVIGKTNSASKRLRIFMLSKKNFFKVNKRTNHIKFWMDARKTLPSCTCSQNVSYPTFEVCWKSAIVSIFFKIPLNYLSSSLKKKKSTKTLELSLTKITFIFLNHLTTSRWFNLRLYIYCISQLNFLLGKNSHCHATRARLCRGFPFGFVLFYFWNGHTKTEEILSGLKVNSVRESRKYFLIMEDY